MRIDDHRKILGSLAHWQSQVAVDSQTVPGGVLDGLHGGHILLIQPGTDICQFKKFVSGAIVKEIFSTCFISKGPDQDFSFVLAKIANPHFYIRQSLFKFFLLIFAILIEENIRCLRFSIANSSQHFSLL